MTVVRIPYRIFVDDDLWRRRTLVTVEPRTIDKPTQSFEIPADAMAYAEALSFSEAWPIVDRRAPAPEAA